MKAIRLLMNVLRLDAVELMDVNLAVPAFQPPMATMTFRFGFVAFRATSSAYCAVIEINAIFKYLIMLG